MKVKRKLKLIKGDDNMIPEEVKEEKEEKEWEFENVSVTLRDGQPYKWHLSMSARQLAELYNYKFIFYEPNIQRGTKITSKGEEKPLIYQKHVKNILNAMLNGTIHGGNISLVYFKEYETPLNYDYETQTLTGKGALAICDGAHRIEACRIWLEKYEKNPGSIKSPDDFYFPVNIEYLTHNQAKNLFSEYSSLGKPISKTRIAYHDVFNPNNAIAQKIMSESELKGKVELISNTIKASSNNFITFATLLNGISVFKPATKREADKVAEFLIEFWDELVNLFPNLMGNVSPLERQENRKKSFAIETMFLNAYFHLAAKLINDKSWRKKLMRLTKNNFLSRDNKIWSPILRNGDKIINTSATQKYVINTILDYVINEKDISELEQ